MGNMLVIIGLLMCIPSFIFGIPIILVGLIIKAISKNQPQTSTMSPALKNFIRAIYNSFHKQNPRKYINESYVSDNCERFGLNHPGDAETCKKLVNDYFDSLKKHNIEILPDEEFVKITKQPIHVLPPQQEKHLPIVQPQQKYLNESYALAKCKRVGLNHLGDAEAGKKFVDDYLDSLKKQKIKIVSDEEFVKITGQPIRVLQPQQRYMKSSTYTATIVKLEKINHDIPDGLKNEIAKFKTLLKNKNITVVADAEFTRLTEKL
jgi:hypothetical protein